MIKTKIRLSVIEKSYTNFNIPLINLFKPERLKLKSSKT